MLIEFDKDYLRELFEQGRTSDIAISPKLSRATKSA